MLFDTWRNTNSPYTGELRLSNLNIRRVSFISYSYLSECIARLYVERLLVLFIVRAHLIAGHKVDCFTATSLSKILKGGYLRNQYSKINYITFSCTCITINFFFKIVKQIRLICLDHNIPDMRLNLVCPTSGSYDNIVLQMLSAHGTQFTVAVIIFCNLF